MLPISLFSQNKIMVSPLVVDRFEDGDVRYNPEWSTFGNLAVTVIPAVDGGGLLMTPPTQASWRVRILSWFNFSKWFSIPNRQVASKVDPVNGRYVLRVEGLGQNWYVGGLCTYLGIKADMFNYFYIRVKGFGPDSGRLQIELYDDDNNNFKLEQDPKNHYEPLYDDKYVYVVPITWTGWRDLLIPIRQFMDSNGAGDHILNLDQSDHSGGLLQIQLVGLTSEQKPTGRFSVEIDSIELR